MQEFFDFPRESFQIRGLSRRTKIAQPSVTNHLRALVEENLIIREKKGIYPAFKANLDSDLFKIYKKLNLLIRMHQSGLISYIYDSCLPNVIILFGSASKGEDLDESDIDLFVLSREKKLDFTKYKKLLNREIALFFEENFSKLSPELKNNILNGIILKGYLKVF